MILFQASSLTEKPNHEQLNNVQKESEIEYPYQYEGQVMKFCRKKTKVTKFPLLLVCASSKLIHLSGFRDTLKFVLFYWIYYYNFPRCE